MKVSLRKFNDFTPFSESGLGSKLLERTVKGPTGKTYRGVTIVRVGRGNKEDNNYYPDSTLREAAKNGIFEGLRAFADHPTAVDEQILPERSIRDIVGIYTNTRFKEASNKQPGRVVGDLTLFPNSSWLSSMIDQLMAMDQTDKIGISINGAGKTIPKRVSLSESGEPDEVNWLESFNILRSADVVTEAGAGGGFQRILESARASSKGKDKMKLTKEQQKEINEATATGDMIKVQELLTRFAETAKNGGASPKKEKGGEKAVKDDKKIKKESDEADNEEVEESAQSEDKEGDEIDEVDHDQELDETAEELKESEEDEDDEELDSEDEDDEDDEDDVEESEASSDMKSSLLAGAKAIRAAATRASKEDRKTLEEDATKLEEAAKRKKKVASGKFQKVGKGGNLTHSVKGQVSVPGQKGPKVAGSKESSKPTIDELQAKLQESEERNKRLSAQLSQRQSIDRGKKLLKESAVPPALRKQVLKEIAGLPERKMRERIEYHESLCDTMLSTLREAVETDDEFDSIEGAGSRQLRESFGRSSRDSMGEEFFTEMGLPLKSN